MPGWFSVMWVPKLLLPPVRNRILCPKYVFLGTNRPCRFIWCPVGCGARAVSCKTPIYFMSLITMTWFWATDSLGVALPWTITNLQPPVKGTKEHFSITCGNPYPIHSPPCTESFFNEIFFRFLYHLLRQDHVMLGWMRWDRHLKLPGSKDIGRLRRGSVHMVRKYWISQNYVCLLIIYPRLTGNI